MLDIIRDMKDLNERIRELREEKSFNQKQLSEKLGVLSETVKKWESGKTTPRITSIIKLAAFFGVTVNYLLGLSDRKQE